MGIYGKGSSKRIRELCVNTVFQYGSDLRVICTHSAPGMKIDSVVDVRMTSCIR